MSDDIRREIEQLDAPPPIQIVITMDVQGNIRIGGTLNKPLYLIYGVLETAKDALRRHFERANSPKIVEATLGDLPPMGRKS